MSQSLPFRNLAMTGRRVLIYLAPTVFFSITSLLTDHVILGHVPYSPPLKWDRLLGSFAKRKSPSL